MKKLFLSLCLCASVVSVFATGPTNQPAPGLLSVMVNSNGVLQQPTNFIQTNNIITGQPSSGLLLMTNPLSGSATNVDGLTVTNIGYFGGITIQTNSAAGTLTIIYKFGTNNSWTNVVTTNTWRLVDQTGWNSITLTNHGGGNINDNAMYWDSGGSGAAFHFGNNTYIDGGGLLYSPALGVLGGLGVGTVSVGSGSWSFDYSSQATAIFADSSGGPSDGQLVMDDGSPNNSLLYCIIRKDSSTNQMTLSAYTQLINGQPSIPVAPLSSKIIISDGTNTFVASDSQSYFCQFTNIPAFNAKTTNFFVRSRIEGQITFASSANDVPKCALIVEQNQGGITNTWILRGPTNQTTTINFSHSAQPLAVWYLTNLCTGSATATLDQLSRFDE